jgi:hypothetical protein
VCASPRTVASHAAAEVRRDGVRSNGVDRDNARSELLREPLTIDAAAFAVFCLRIEGAERHVEVRDAEHELALEERDPQHHVMTVAQPQRSWSGRLIHNVFLRPDVLVAAILWILANVAVLLLANGRLPFDRPALVGMSFAQQVALPSLGLVEVSVLMAVVYALTSQRVIPDIAARAPERSQAARETAALLGYAGLGEVGGWLLGPALGYRSFSFHVAGTLVGCSTPPSIGEVWTWAIYNFVVFAVAPYLWFRRSYSATQLNLRSTDRRNDLLVIVVVGVIEVVVEVITFPGIFKMRGRTFLVAAPLTLGVFTIGTVLPTMVLIYAILVPRYLKLTGSFVTTVLLGGLTYAAMHFVEGWSVFTTSRNVALSLLFVVLGYLGPGMIKTFLTLRTGNAWVHAIGYHAIAPHMMVDAPLMAKVFGLR